MARRWCSIQNKLTRRGSESNSVTTSSASKISRSSPPRRRPVSRQRFKMRSLFISVFLALVVTAGAAVKKEAASPPPNKDVKQKPLSLVRVNVTGQPYDYFRPWQKKAPVSKRALGAVLSKGRVLVTADLVINQNYVELERAESGEKTAANVQVIDYEANLALLEPTEKTFLKGITPLEISPDTVVGDRLAAWQLEPSGALLATEGLVTTVQMMPYPIDIGEFLTYR